MDPAPGPQKPKLRPNIAFARVNTASFRGERGDATLRIPQDLIIKPGAQLAEGCFIGKELGRGIQVCGQFLVPHIRGSPAVSRTGALLKRAALTAPFTLSKTELNVLCILRIADALQGVVYELLNERSEPMSLVLKALPHGRVSAVTGVLPSMEREWAVGHRLALYCTSTSGGTHAACARNKD